MFTYQLGWANLLLSWERDEQAEYEAVTPAPGYRWSRLDDPCNIFYERWHGVSLPRLQQVLRGGGDGVIALVVSPSREEFFDSRQRAWVSSTPSTQPVTKWMHINTVVLFTSFRTKTRAWKRG